MHTNQTFFALSLAGVKLSIHVGMRTKGNAIVKVLDLREGMVLAKDVHNARGILLVREKTRLSMTVIERIKKVLPQGHTLEVQEAMECEAAA